GIVAGEGGAVRDHRAAGLVETGTLGGEIGGEGDVGERERRAGAEGGNPALVEAAAAGGRGAVGDGGVGVEGDVLEGEVAVVEDGAAEVRGAAREIEVLESDVGARIDVEQAQVIAAGDAE